MKAKPYILNVYPKVNLFNNINDDSMLKRRRLTNIRRVDLNKKSSKRSTITRYA